MKWDESGISLQNIDLLDVEAKYRSPSYISDQFLYFEILNKGESIYESVVIHPRRTHVEYIDEKGKLNRHDSLLASSEFTVRIPANIKGDQIQFLLAKSSKRAKLNSKQPFSKQNGLLILKTISIALIKN